MKEERSSEREREKANYEREVFRMSESHPYFVPSIFPSLSLVSSVSSAQHIFLGASRASLMPPLVAGSWIFRFDMLFERARG